MPLRVTPEEAAARWVAGLSAAGPKIEAGIDRVTVSPGQKAAQNADKWLNSVSQARDKFAKGAGAVSLADWQAAAKAGASAVASGAQRRQGKFATKITPVFAHLATGVARVDSMPTTTYEQRKARAIAMMDHMHGYRR